MTAFCETLLKEIINGTEIHIDITQVPPERLFNDLNAEKYDGVISLLLPSPSLTAGYSYLFSSPIYRVGPVLVINASEPIKPLEQMSGNLIALVGDARLSTDIDNYPTVIFTGYDDIAQAFADLNNRKIDGLITDSIRAKNFVSGFYINKFHVADFLKDDEGIRLILRNNKTGEFFLHFFNKKLAELRADGTYTNLLEMWKIPPE
jgi:ABC-type amino acid transport substrate-binding protein